MLRQAFDLGMGRERRELGVAVVLTDKDHRQSPEAGDVERLVKWPGLAGAVAEEDHRELALFSFFRGKGCAEGERNGAADHAGGGDEAALFGDDMHRAALAAAVTAGAAGDLGH